VSFLWGVENKPIMLGVTMLNVVMLNVVAPCICPMIFCRELFGQQITLDDLTHLIVFEKKKNLL
jgi:hypothetical protein